MTLELLLAISCISEPTSCRELHKPYLASRPALKQRVRNVRHVVTRKLGRELTWSMPVAYAMVTQKTTQFRIRGPLTLRLGSTEATLIWEKEF